MNDENHNTSSSSNNSNGSRNMNDKHYATNVFVKSIPMLGLVFLSTLFAVVHHVVCSNLDGDPIEDLYLSEFWIRAFLGGLVLFEKFMILTSIFIGFREIIWYRLRSRPSTIDFADKAFSVTSNPVALFYPSLWKKSTFAMLVASVAWLLPVLLSTNFGVLTTAYEYKSRETTCNQPIFPLANSPSLRNQIYISSGDESIIPSPKFSQVVAQVIPNGNLYDDEIAHLGRRRDYRLEEFQAPILQCQNETVEAALEIIEQSNQTFDTSQDVFVSVRDPVSPHSRLWIVANNFTRVDQDDNYTTNSTSAVSCLGYDSLYSLTYFEYDKGPSHFYNDAKLESNLTGLDIGSGLLDDGHKERVYIAVFDLFFNYFVGKIENAQNMTSRVFETSVPLSMTASSSGQIYSVFRDFNTQVPRLFEKVVMGSRKIVNTYDMPAYVDGNRELYQTVDCSDMMKEPVFVYNSTWLMASYITSIVFAFIVLLCVNHGVFRAHGIGSNGAFSQVIIVNNSVKGV